MRLLRCADGRCIVIAIYIATLAGCSGANKGFTSKPEPTPLFQAPPISPPLIQTPLPEPLPECRKTLGGEIRKALPASGPVYSGEEVIWEVQVIPGCAQTNRLEYFDTDGFSRSLPFSSEMLTFAKNYRSGIYQEVVRILGMDQNNEVLELLEMRSSLLVVEDRPMPSPTPVPSPSPSPSMSPSPSPEPSPSPSPTPMPSPSPEPSPSPSPTPMPSPSPEPSPSPSPTPMPSPSPSPATCSGPVSVNPALVKGCRKGRQPNMTPQIIVTVPNQTAGDADTFVVAANISVRKDPDCAIVCPFSISCDGFGNRSVQSNFVCCNPFHSQEFFGVDRDPTYSSQEEIQCVSQRNNHSLPVLNLGNFGGDSDYGGGPDDYIGAHWRQVQILGR